MGVHIHDPHPPSIASMGGRVQGQGRSARQPAAACAGPRLAGFPRPRPCRAFARPFLAPPAPRPLRGCHRNRRRPRWWRRWLAGVELRGPGHRPRLRRFRQVIDGPGAWEAAAAAYIANSTSRATARSTPAGRPLEAAAGNGPTTGSPGRATSTGLGGEQRGKEEGTQGAGGIRHTGLMDVQAVQYDDADASKILRCTWKPYPIQPDDLTWRCCG